MAKDIHVPARIIGGKIPVKASLGQTVIVTEGPEEYTGPTTVTPTESEQTLLTKDKLLTENISVNPIPSEYTDAKADYEDALTAFGVESDLADGINALTEYSNEITGEQGETLSDAVRSLADGYDDGSKAAGLIDGTFTGEYWNDAPMSGIQQRKFRAMTNLTGIELPNCTGAVEDYAFDGCSNLERAILPNVTELKQYAFNTCAKLTDIDVRNVEIIGSFCFRGNSAYKPKIVFLKPLTITGRLNINATVMHICQNIVSMASDSFSASNIIDLYVPWSEGEYPDVVKAGIRNIHYNTVSDSEGNIISST